MAKTTATSWIVERIDGTTTRPQDAIHRTEVARTDTPEAARAELWRLKAELPRGSADWYEVRAA